VEVRISNYGKLSRKKDELLKLLTDNNIPAYCVNYDDTEQYCGGWVKFGISSLFNYTENELTDLFKNCHYSNFPVTWLDGKIYICDISASGVERGIVPEKIGSYVDLLSDASNMEKRIGILNLMKYPSEACKYCNGFDTINGERVVAAVQW
jgi:hypothetical protein